MGREIRRVPANKDCYVPYDSSNEELCMWWQCYETISKGCPVSPAFSTAEELIDYLTTHGDFWEQSQAREENRAVRPWDRIACEILIRGPEGVEILEAIDTDE